MIEKRSFIYDAIAEGLRAFEERHYINARRHFAPLMGYRGPNAHIQLSSALNTRGYNPANPKRLSVDQLAVVLEEIDEEERFEILSKIVDRYGYSLQRAPRAEKIRAGVNEALRIALDLDRKHGRLAEALMEAVEDGEIDAEERKEIEEAGYRLRQAAKEMMEAIR